jgi:lipopolysaccharide/colanic/teichoic acid biosynthesis glycosyltransferase
VAEIVLRCARGTAVLRRGMEMHRWLILLVDLGLIALATVASSALRYNFEMDIDRLFDLFPYLVTTLSVSLFVSVIGQMNRGLWRYSSLSDYMRIAFLSVLIVILSVAISFAVNRLENVARSLPFIQLMLMIGALTSARVLRGIWFRRRVAAAHRDLEVIAPEGVLIIGINSIAEMYILACREFRLQQIKVLGLLSEEKVARKGRLQGVEILGSAEDLNAILSQLEVHGESPQRLVVATKFAQLTERQRAIILELENSSSIFVDVLAERLFSRDSTSKEESVSSSSETSASLPSEEMSLADKAAIDARKAYFEYKRVVDFLFAVVLSIILMPLIVAVALLTAFDVGFPILFWQTRPGLLGRPFKLYKFRTMAGAHDVLGRRIPDDERMSPVGRMMRRTRFDELPQLFNVLKGEMSFIGPRPLLPVDQPVGYLTRVSIRPGITGWAQVNGGNAIALSEKAALDYWYVKNASVRVDLDILGKTIFMVLFGERRNEDAIRNARLSNSSGTGKVLG